jgi:predicted O-methyltransferase YrrM
MKLNLPIVSEGTWDKVESKYEAYNSGGVELEVGDFLYGMVRILKPQHILETGTHQGISSSYMGLALKDNGFGHLDTWEIFQINYDMATAKFKEYGIEDYVTCHLEDFRISQPPYLYDMLFLDSEPQYRFAELVKMFHKLKAGGYAFIHDLHHHMSQVGGCQPFGKLPTEILEWLREDELRLFHFPNPRGMVGFYKVAAGDYDPYQLGV